MLRSHHHLRGFIKTSSLCEWMLVYPVGYVGVGFEGNCDYMYGILYDDGRYMPKRVVLYFVLL